MYGKFDDKNKIIIILLYNNNTKHYKIINNIFINDNQLLNEADSNIKLDAELFEGKPDSPKYYKENNQKTKENNKNININLLSLFIDKEDAKKIDLYLASDIKSEN